MPKKDMNYGELAFLAGVILAFVVGVLSSFLPEDLVPLLIGVLAVLGLVVGLVNVREKEVNSFLIAAIAFLTAAAAWTYVVDLLNLLPGGVGETLALAIAGFVAALAAFISPAAFIVALEAIYKLSNKE